MRGPALALLAMLALTADAAAAPSASDAWIPSAPPTATVHAGYLTLVNPGSVAVRLVAVRSDVHQRVALHETIADGATMTMRPVDEVTIAPGATLRFAPGGLHMMLLEPRRALAVGDRVTLTLCFDDGSSISVAAEVRDGRGARTDHGHHHR